MLADQLLLRRLGTLVGIALACCHAFLSVLLRIEHFHNRHYIHRDIKPVPFQNWLYLPLQLGTAVKRCLTVARGQFLDWPGAEVKPRPELNVALELRMHGSVFTARCT